MSDISEYERGFQDAEKLFKNNGKWDRPYMLYYYYHGYPVLTRAGYADIRVEDWELAQKLVKQVYNEEPKNNRHYALPDGWTVKVQPQIQYTDDEFCEFKSVNTAMWEARNADDPKHARIIGILIPPPDAV